MCMRSPFIEPWLVNLTFDGLMDVDSEQVDTIRAIPFDVTTLTTQGIAHILVKVRFIENQMEHMMPALCCINNPQQKQVDLSSLHNVGTQALYHPLSVDPYRELKCVVHLGVN